MKYNAKKAGFPVVVLISLMVYYLSLAPGITIANLGMDTGEFAICAAELGIPHPTGYPVYNLLGKIFTKNPVFSGKETAFKTNFMSAFFASLTAGLLYLILLRLIPSLVISFLGSLCFALTRTFWSQAVITEVYTLNLFFSALFLLFAISYINEPEEEKYFWGSTFALGMGLTNHTLCVLLVPLYVYIIIIRTSIVSLKKTGFGILIMLLCGLSYVYLPIRAFADPVINIGDPGNFGNILWVMLAKPFRGHMFSLPEGKLFYQLYQYPILAQFTLLEILVGVIGLWELLKKNTKVFVLLLGLFTLNIAYSLNYDISDIGAYFLMSYLVFSIWVAYGVFSIMEFIADRCQLILNRKVVVTGIAVAFVLVLNTRFRTNFTVVTEPSRKKAMSYAKNIFRDLHEKDSIFLVMGANKIIPLQYYKYEYLKNCGTDLVDVNWLIWDWYLEQLENRGILKIPEINLEKLAENVNNRYRQQIREASSNIAQYAFLRVEVIRLLIRENVRIRPMYTNCTYHLLEDEFYFAKIRKGLYKLAEK